MDIALSSLAAPLVLPAFGRGRSERSGVEQRTDTITGSANSQARDAALNNGRVIPGEVLSSRSEPARNTYENQSAFLRDENSRQSDFRRFSIPAAMQAFRDNEALVTENNQPRQVSGIIDEYV